MRDAFRWLLIVASLALSGCTNWQAIHDTASNLVSEAKTGQAALASCRQLGSDEAQRTAACAMVEKKLQNIRDNSERLADKAKPHL